MTDKQQQENNTHGKELDEKALKAAVEAYSQSLEDNRYTLQLLVYPKCIEASIRAYLSAAPKGDVERLQAEIERKDEVLMIAQAYIAYTKEFNPVLHLKADGTPSITRTIQQALQNNDNGGV